MTALIDVPIVLVLHAPVSAKTLREMSTSPGRTRGAERRSTRRRVLGMQMRENGAADDQQFIKDAGRAFRDQTSGLGRPRILLVVGARIELTTYGL